MLLLAVNILTVRIMINWSHLTCILMLFRIQLVHSSIWLSAKKNLSTSTQPSHMSKAVEPEMCISTFVVSHNTQKNIYSSIQFYVVGVINPWMKILKECHFSTLLFQKSLWEIRWAWLTHYPCVRVDGSYWLIYRLIHVKQISDEWDKLRWKFKKVKKIAAD